METKRRSDTVDTGQEPKEVDMRAPVILGGTEVDKRVLAATIAITLVFMFWTGTDRRFIKR